MKTKKNYAFILIGLVGLALLIGAVLIILNQASLHRLERLQALYAPPDVYIVSPLEGAVIQPGSFELVEVAAVGPNPVNRIEIWLDGIKLDEAVNEDPALTSGFNATFPVQILEGAHMLVARVIDNKGIIGQSPPLGIYGDPEMAEADDQSQAFVLAQEGQTLGDLANTFSVPAAELQTSNPGISEGNLTAGDLVIVPPSPGNAAADSPPPAQTNGDVVISLPDVPMLKVNPKYLTPSLVLFSAGADQNRPVAAPSGLQVEFRDCKILMSWYDNADNELAYSVWMSDFILPGRVIANLQPSPTTGRAWFQFDAPPPGPYGFWVVAANWLGAQQSEIVWFRVENHNCPSQTARDLEFEIVLMDIMGGYDRAYCYVSVEGRSEARIPPRDDTFYFSSPAGQPNAPRKNLFSIPEDNELNLEGECWRWLGGNLAKIGDLKEAIPRSLWDGKVHSMAVGSSSIFYTINPLGDLKAIGQYAYADHNITPPDSLREKVAVESVPAENAKFDPQRILFWEWKGTEAINGFTVYVNGVAVKQVGPAERKTLITLPSRCGDTIKYEVAATMGKSESLRAALTIRQDPCPIQATVEFVELQLWGADDTVDPLINPSGFGISCSSYLEVYFTLSASFGANMEKRVYFNEDSPLKPALACGTYDFPILVVGSPLHRYPPPPDKVTITGFLFADNSNTANVGVGVSMFDDDDFYDDKIVSFFTFFVDSIENWKTYDKTETFLFFEFPDASGSITIRVTGERLTP